MGDNTARNCDDSVTVKINELLIRGFNSSSGISNFLGVPYASIPERFRQAALIDPRQRKGFVDATKYGPQCPQPVDVSRSLMNHLYTGFEISTSAPVSEDACLVLNIYTPPEALASREKLPVIVFIHGGGWALGDGNADYGEKLL
jgi:carboxylesterase type B